MQQCHLTFVNLPADSQIEATFFTLFEILLMIFFILLQTFGAGLVLFPHCDYSEMEYPGCSARDPAGLGQNVLLFDLLQLRTRPLMSLLSLISLSAFK